MTTSAEHPKIEEMITAATMRERRRCVGMVLAAYGVCQLAGHEDTAQILDALATKMETDE